MVIPDVDPWEAGVTGRQVGLQRQMSEQSHFGRNLDPHLFDTDCIEDGNPATTQAPFRPSWSG